MSTDYRRTFPPDLDGGGPPGDYIRPREFVDSDEDEIFARVAAAFVSDTRRLAANAGRDDPSFHEPHWGHSTGLLRGTLDIDAVHALPERFRVGLFDANESYPVVCRPNFIVDRKLRLAAARMAIKSPTRLRCPTSTPRAARRMSWIFSWRREVRRSTGPGTSSSRGTRERSRCSGR
jgi:hypothetical protein